MGRVLRISEESWDPAQPPALHAGHPLRTGLVFAGLPFGSGLYDAFSKSAGIISATSGWPGVVPLPQQNGSLYAQGAQNGARFLNTSGQKQGQKFNLRQSNTSQAFWTLACICRSLTFPSSDVGLLNLNNGTSSSDTVFLGFNGTGDGASAGPNMFCAVGSNTNNPVYNVTTSNALWMILGRTNGTSFHDLWVNGIQRATDTSNLGTYAAMGNLYVSYDSTTSGEYSDSIIAQGMVWNRMLSAAEVFEWFRNPYGVFQAASRRIWIGTTSSGAALAGNATDVVAATGALSTGIQMAGAAAAQATAIGALTTGIPMQGAVLVVATANGNISTGINLAGSAAMVVSANGALSTSIFLEGSALARATMAAALSTGIPLQGAAAAQATATGALTTGIAAQGAAADQVTAAGGLSTSITMQGVMQALATMTGDLTIQIRLNGAALVQATAAAGLDTHILVAGALQSVATMNGALNGGVQFQGNAVAQSSADGTLTTSITLSGAALAQAIASGALSAHIQFNGTAAAQATMTGALTGHVFVPSPAAATLRYPRENRVLKPRAENRVLIYPAENRTLRIERYGR